MIKPVRLSVVHSPSIHACAKPTSPRRIRAVIGFHEASWSDTWGSPPGPKSCTRPCGSIRRSLPVCNCASMRVRAMAATGSRAGVWGMETDRTWPGCIGSIEDIRTGSG